MTELHFQMDYSVITSAQVPTAAKTTGGKMKHIYTHVRTSTIWLLKRQFKNFPYNSLLTGFDAKNYWRTTKALPVCGK